MFYMLYAITSIKGPSVLGIFDEICNTCIISAFVLFDDDVPNSYLWWNMHIQYKVRDIYTMWFGLRFFSFIGVSRGGGIIVCSFVHNAQICSFLWFLNTHHLRWGIFLNDIFYYHTYHASPSNRYPTDRNDRSRVDGKYFTQCAKRLGLLLMTVFDSTRIEFKT